MMCIHFREYLKRRRRRKHGKIHIRVVTSYKFHKNRAYIIKGDIYMVGIGKAILNVTITPPVGEASQTSIVAADDGSFSVEFLATMSGSFKVLVEYVGDALHLSSSAMLTIDVVPKPPEPVPTTITLVAPVDPVQEGNMVQFTGVISEP
jgi:hypothetical protein